MTYQFQEGDKVRENRQGAPVETVIAVYGTSLVTDGSLSTLHVTKAVLVERAQ